MVSRLITGVIVWLVIFVAIITAAIWRLFRKITAALAKLTTGVAKGTQAVGKSASDFIISRPKGMRRDEREKKMEEIRIYLAEYKKYRESLMSAHAQDVWDILHGELPENMAFNQFFGSHAADDIEFLLGEIDKVKSCHLTKCRCSCHQTEIVKIK